MFITFEGIDGCGKSTQLALLAHYLKKKKRAVTVTREPGGSPIAETIRRIVLDPENSRLDPVAELMLYCSARSQHVAEVIAPALKQGRIVLCDRFSDATAAYQGGGRGISLKTIEGINAIACGSLKPDITFLIDIPAKESLKRMKASGKRLDRMEKTGRAFLEKVRRSYLRLARKEPGRIKILDGTRSITALAHEIAAVCDKKMR